MMTDRSTVPLVLGLLLLLPPPLLVVCAREPSSPLLDTIVFAQPDARHRLQSACSEQTQTNFPNSIILTIVCGESLHVATYDFLEFAGQDPDLTEQVRMHRSSCTRMRRRTASGLSH